MHLTLLHRQCVILTETPLALQIKINEYCRARGIYFLAADVRGLFCWSFTDVGDAFEVLDKNGEDPPEVLIESITQVTSAKRRGWVWSNQALLNRRRTAS